MLKEMVAGRRGGGGGGTNSFVVLLTQVLEVLAMLKMNGGGGSKSFDPLKGEHVLPCLEERCKKFRTRDFLLLYPPPPFS